MLTGLPSDWDVYAVTSSDATNYSYMCYYNYSLSAFMGDVFGVMWMRVRTASQPTTATHS